MTENMKPTLKFSAFDIAAADLGEKASVPDLIGHINLQQSNTEFDLSETDEIYEGYGQYPNSYPYRQNNGYASELKRREVKIAILENEYLRAEFLTELGGRLWSLVDKNTGKNLLYTNDVLQFRNLAVCNAWFSGGVEWNIGIIGHSPFTTEPLYVAELEEAGHPVLRMYEYERIRGVSFQMDFWLEESSRFLNCRMRIVNPRQEVVPMYWWSNMAVPEYDGGRIIVPSKRAYTSKGGKVYKVDIPIVEGVDITRYQAIPQMVDYFFELEKEFPTYIAHVDKGGYGLLHLSTKRLQSRKLFSWGNQEGSARWQEFLTKAAGRYIEIQAGLGKTQYGCIPMAPHTAWEWLEQYGAIQLSEAELYQPYEELIRTAADYIVHETEYTGLEEKLDCTKKMAKTPVGYVEEGSIFGGGLKECKGMEHLVFSGSKGNMRPDGWTEFLETGILLDRDPADRPSGYMFGKEYLATLRDTVHTINKNNWYAHYQLGVLEYQEGQLESAKKALLESLRLKENAWAYHGMACVYLQQGIFTNTSANICKGMKMRKNDISYIKEGFRLLHICGDNSTITSLYEELTEDQKKESRIRFFCVRALHETGRSEEAFVILNENGGWVPDDFREGETSVEELWRDIQEKVMGKKLPVPHIFRFSADQK